MILLAVPLYIAISLVAGRTLFFRFNDHNIEACASEVADRLSHDENMAKYERELAAYNERETKRRAKGYSYDYMTHPGPPFPPKYRYQDHRTHATKYECLMAQRDGGFWLFWSFLAGLAWPILLAFAILVCAVVLVAKGVKLAFSLPTIEEKRRRKTVQLEQRQKEIEKLALEYGLPQINWDEPKVLV